MKLYYSPGACSLGIHVLMEEIGQPYELQRLNFPEGDQHKPEFQAVNRKGKVPTLVRDDGAVLTEFPAIAWWLALSNPGSKLLPGDAEGQARTLEALDYIVGTLHGQGFGRIFRPVKFTPREADHEEVKAQGREVFEKGLRLMTSNSRASSISWETSESPTPRCSTSSSGPAGSASTCRPTARPTSRA